MAGNTTLPSVILVSYCVPAKQEFDDAVRIPTIRQHAYVEIRSTGYQGHRERHPRHHSDRRELQDAVRVPNGGGLGFSLAVSLPRRGTVSNKDRKVNEGSVVEWSKELGFRVRGPRT